MNWIGVILGAASFCIIGVWHGIVIKGEYYFGKTACVWIFAIIGLACLIPSLLTKSDYLSLFLALFGFSAFWGIHEVYEQEKRVEHGWFPRNPKRKSTMQ
jgi:hypothetical protein